MVFFLILMSEPPSLQCMLSADGTAEETKATTALKNELEYTPPRKKPKTLTFGVIFFHHEKKVNVHPSNFTRGRACLQTHDISQKTDKHK